MITYEVEFEGLEEQLDLLQDYEEIAGRELNIAMDQSVNTIKFNVKPFVPLDRGRLRSSIGSEIQDLGNLSIVGRVGPQMADEIYPQVMEFGREPGGKFPPMDMIQAWVHRVIRPKAEEERSIAFLVARKIAKQGIKGRFYLKQGWEKSQQDVKQFFADALERIAQGLSNKRM